MAKSYLDLTGLGLYDSKIKALIADAKTAGVNAQTEVDALEAYVGQIPTGYTETDIVSFILKVAEETLNSASGGSSESAASVLAALNTYKASNDVRVKAIEDDYLKAADKTELTTEIAKKANSADVYAKTEVDTKLSTKADKATTLAGYGITDAYTKTETDTKIATAKQEAIETILGEAVPEQFDTLKEVADWIQSDTTSSAQLVTRVTTLESEMDAAQADIATNKSDINTIKITMATKEETDLIVDDIDMLKSNASNYATKTEVSTAEANAKAYTDAEIDKLDTSASAAITAVGERVAKIEADYATKTIAQGYATTAETNAKTYADNLATNYDAAGSAAQALVDAKAYTDEITAIATADIEKLFA